MQAIPKDFLVPGSDSCKVPLMAEIRNFYDFESLKACRAFVKAIGLTLRSPEFGSDRILAAQMQRASISVLSNFAEGFEREGNTEFIQFLSVSKGSVGELRAQLIYSLDLGLLEEQPFSELDALGESATRLLGGLIRYLGKSEKRGRKYDNRKQKARAKKRAHKSTPGDRQPPTANRQPPTANR
jgi:four helix bundle protein